MECIARWDMQRNLFGIGNGRYEFNRQTLDNFIEEARRNCSHSEGSQAGNAPGCGDWETRYVYEEILGLYREYQKCQSLDLLVRLKCRLQEISIRYGSHVLAAEVININSCLPYEARISHPTKM
jgi:hypothetical protein